MAAFTDVYGFYVPFFAHVVLVLYECSATMYYLFYDATRYAHLH